MKATLGKQLCNIVNLKPLISVTNTASVRYFSQAHIKVSEKVDNSKLSSSPQESLLKNSSSLRFVNNNPNLR